MDNQTIIQYFEWNLPADQNHWNYIREHAPRMRELGITMAWLPPAYKGTAGINDVGYGVYDRYDLGEFDQKGTIATKYGTKDEYLAAIKALQDNEIIVLADIVINQMLGADGTEKTYATPVDPDDRLKEIGKAREIEAYTYFNFPGRNGKYSNFEFHWNQFSGVDFDGKTDETGIFRFSGKEWNNPVDDEYGNFDYLMGADLDMDDERTREELLNWGRWYCSITNLDGFRLDAVKHIKFPFMAEWVQKMRDYMKEKLGKDHVLAVGEYWSGDVNKLIRYINDSDHKIQLFDVPLHFNFEHASKAGGNYDMAHILDNTLIRTETFNSITFVDNHDTQPGESLQSWVETWFKPIAYAIILLQQYGIPCVFFGDYRGMPHDYLAPVAGIDELLLLRKKHAYGLEYPYFDDFNVVGFTREGDDEHPNSGLAVLLSDNVGGQKEMYIGEQFFGEEFIDYLGNVDGSVYIKEDGKGVFSCAGGSVSVWVPRKSMNEQEMANRQYRLDHGSFDDSDIEPQEKVVDGISEEVLNKNKENKENE